MGIHMKLKDRRIFLLGSAFFVLLFLSLSCVSAADNSTVGNLTTDDVNSTTVDNSTTTGVDITPACNLTAGNINNTTVANSTTDEVNSMKGSFNGAIAGAIGGAAIGGFIGGPGGAAIGTIIGFFGGVMAGFLISKDKIRTPLLVECMLSIPAKMAIFILLKEIVKKRIMISH